MELIDDEGRLFGVVNVIDALVVLLVLAVVVAGFALLDPFATTEEATRYATVDLGDQQPYVAEQLSAGDVMSPIDAPRNVTVTDVYTGPAAGENVSASVRVRINGTLEEGTTGSVFSYAGDRIRQGGQFTLETDDYTAEGTITRLAGEGTELDTVTRRVRLDGSASPQTVDRLQSGETVSFAGRDGATVETVHVGPGGDASSRRVVATVTVDALRQPDGFVFGEQSLALGQSLSLDFEEYSLSGRIEAIGEDADVRTESRTVTLATTVSEQVATRLQPGDEYLAANQTVATIDDIHIGPGGDTSSRRVVAAVTVDALRQPDGFVFGQQPLALGQSLSLDFEEYSLSGRIEAIGEDAQVRTESRTVALTATVPERVATRLQAGDTYEIDGEPVATIETVSQYPGPGDDQRRLYLEATLETTREGEDRYFGPTELDVGQSVPFRTSEYSLIGTIETFNQSVGTATTSVAVETTVSNTVADAIESGDAFEVAGQPIATVQALEVYPTGDRTTRRVLLGLDVRTVTRGGTAYFGTDRISLGSSIPFETDDYQLSGTIIGRNSYTPDGDTQTRTLTVKVENADPEFADGIETGMVERSLGEVTAEIVEKRTEPASVILTSEDGDIFERTHPQNQDVYLTVEATLRERDDGYQFHARSIKEGDSMTLDFRTITVRGTVTTIQSDQ